MSLFSIFLARLPPLAPLRASWNPPPTSLWAAPAPSGWSWYPPNPTHTQQLRVLPASSSTPSPSVPPHRPRPLFGGKGCGALPPAGRGRVVRGSHTLWDVLLNLTAQPAFDSQSPGQERDGGGRLGPWVPVLPRLLTPGLVLYRLLILINQQGQAWRETEAGRPRDSLTCGVSWWQGQGPYWVGRDPARRARPLSAPASASSQLRPGARWGARQRQRVRAPRPRDGD